MEDYTKKDFRNIRFEIKTFTVSILHLFLIFTAVNALDFFIGNTITYTLYVIICGCCIAGLTIISKRFFTRLDNFITKGENYRFSVFLHGENNERR